MHIDNRSYCYVSLGAKDRPVIISNHVEALPAQSPSGGGRVRARGGRLQRRSASFPCGTSAIQAFAQRQDQAFPEKDRSRLSPLAIGVGRRR